MQEGVSDDVLMGYPTVDRPALARLLADHRARAAITLMVDDTAQLDQVAAAAGRAARRGVRIALDVDAGLRLGRAHVGPKRSPLHDAPAARALAEEVVRRASRWWA